MSRNGHTYHLLGSLQYNAVQPRYFLADATAREFSGAEQSGLAFDGRDRYVRTPLEFHHEVRVWDEGASVFLVFARW